MDTEVHIKMPRWVLGVGLFFVCTFASFGSGFVVGRWSAPNPIIEARDQFRREYQEHQAKQQVVIDRGQKQLGGWLESRAKQYTREHP